MKVQTTITVEDSLMLEIMDKLREGKFRNKSHLFEFAAKKLLEED